MQILNRKKKLVEYNPQRVKDMIQLCAKNTDINSIELETKLLLTIVDKQTTTQEIQNNLIQGAVSLAVSVETSDWLKVAGALNLMDLKKQIDADRPSPCKESFWEVLYHQYLQNNYILVSDLNTVAKFEELIQDLDDDTLDSNFDYAGSVLLRDRYLLPNEKPQEMFKTCALILGQTPELAAEIYRALSSLKLSLATPFLSNLRSPKASLSSCFITTVGDSLESIMQGIKDVANISKQGGGVGINMSQIRAKGSSVNGVKNASGGVVPWIKIINDVAIAVSQVKSNRKGAVTTALDIWHKDVYDFLEMQTENGDLRTKCYDVFPQLVVPDLFMVCAIKDEDWYLFDPYELKKYELDLCETWGKEWEVNYKLAVSIPEISKVKVKAKDLLKTVMKSQIETGLPYLFFKDTVNYANLNNKTGLVPSGNLCMESFSNVDVTETHCCNLISLNLAKIESVTEAKTLAKLAVQTLDKALDYTTTPTSTAHNHNQKYRTIGVGIMGLADYLAKNKISYSAVPAQSLVKDIFYACLEQSIDLASEKGSYPSFTENKVNWINAHETNLSEEYRQKLELHGVRNGQLMAIAPNTSTSLLYGATASFLPPYELFFVNKDSLGSIPVVAPYAKTHAEYYTKNRDIDQKTVVDVVSAMQEYVDQGISMELLFDLNAPDFNAKTMYDTLVYAWVKGCKTVYYVRTIQKTLKKGCEACAN